MMTERESKQAWDLEEEIWESNAGSLSGELA